MKKEDRYKHKWKTRTKICESEGVGGNQTPPKRKKQPITKLTQNPTPTSQTTPNTQATWNQNLKSTKKNHKPLNLHKKITHNPMIKSINCLFDVNKRILYFLNFHFASSEDYLSYLASLYLKLHLQTGMCKWQSHLIKSSKIITFARLIY